MDPQEANGQTFIGAIKSYSIGKGYGFAISDKVDGDVFFVHKNLPKDVIHRTQDDRDFKLDGKEVAFTLEISGDGKPTAVDMRLLAEMGPWSGGKDKGAPKGHPKNSRDKGSKGGSRTNDWDEYRNNGNNNSKGGGGGGRRGPDRDRDCRGNGSFGGRGRDGRESYGKGSYNPYDDYYAEGKGHTGITTRSSGGGKGSSKNERKAADRGGKRKMEMTEPGIPLLDERAQAKMKSYSNGSKWGFAICDPAVGDFGDIFVHANNLDDSLTSKGIQLRDGDVIEMDLEEVDCKPVAKNVTLVPQEANAYASQWMRGTIKQFSAEKGYGFIQAPRIWGDIWFSKSDMAKSMIGNCNSTDVMFRLTCGIEGKPKAKFVNSIRGLGGWEGEERAREIIDSLHADGFVDETAVKSLRDTDPAEFICILPELAFYKADNPSSFILGALSRSRKGFRSEKGGGGKGKNHRSAPY